MTSITQRSFDVKRIAAGLGFDFCGIAKAEFLEEDSVRLQEWLRNGMQGKMSYMENHFDLRTDPTKLVPGAQSVITLLYNYFPAQQQNAGAPKISKYAYGQDYHELIREKLNEFFSIIKTEFGDIHGRGFVDSAPVLERSWARKSGLGWIGKNGNIINNKKGSFFFISSLITDLQLEADAAFVTDFCGSCTRCIDACPTDAILPGKVINGSKCISYFTIELKDALLPENEKGKFENWMFGCDICQDVCPWNRFANPTSHVEIAPISAVLNFSTRDWEELTEEEFKKIFKNSAIKRTKFSGIKRNLKFITNPNYES